MVPCFEGTYRPKLVHGVRGLSFWWREQGTNRGGCMNSEASWQIARIGGIAIRIHPSWAVIFFLVGYTFYVILDLEFPDLGVLRLLIVAALMTVLFFGSVLLHELAHAFVSEARGIPVLGITLFFFGGATHAKPEDKEPVDELVISAVGPITSLVLGFVSWAVVNGLSGILSDDVAFAIGRLGWLNVFLAVFNLVPGFPLDGGRILRSIIWQRTGSLARATRIASRAGQTVGYLIAALGAVQILAGGLIGGLWLVAIGWFLAQAAKTSYRQMQLRQLLRDVTAGELMSQDLVAIPAQITLQEAIDGYFMRYEYNAFPVHADATTAGLLTLTAVRRVPHDDWSTITVQAAMEPLSESCTVEASDAMDRVLEKFEETDAGRVLVVDEGTVVGIITPRNVASWLQRTQELGLAQSPIDGRLRDAGAPGGKSSGGPL